MARSSPIRGLLGQPAFLLTLFVSIAAWMAAFIGQIIYESKYQSQKQLSPGSAVGVNWFGIFLQLAVIVSIFITLASDTVERNRNQLSIFLAITIVFGVFGTNLGIFTTTSFQRAIGAGWILLTMIDIIWLLYFSAEEGSMFLRLFNSTSRSFTARGSNPAHRNGLIAQRSTGIGASNHQATGGASSFVGGAGYKSSGVNMSVADLSNQGHAEEGVARGGEAETMSPSVGAPSLLDGQSAEYSQKARALYSYSASPDDPNELSFTKGEILDITDTSGKWWQARKTDAASGIKTTGIVPSNYLVIV